MVFPSKQYDKNNVNNLAYRLHEHIILQITNV